MTTQSIVLHQIELSGIIDGTCMSKVRCTVESLNLKSDEIVLIDLEKVEFMDSSGLSALIMAFKHVRAAGAKLHLCSPTDQVKVLLELTSMDQLFSIYGDRSAFQASLHPLQTLSTY